MSSTPSIEIDWSSTSQRSYVQLGDFTPPDNNSADILYNTERPALLSAKDILSLDIDDIYPYTYSTLHFEDNKTEYIYDDEVYFQQLLQANLNAEIEVISVLKNDKPFVDDTPLTPIQEINPMPPLDTAPLSDNLPIVENINPIPPLDTVPLLENLPIVENINPIPPLDTAPLSENLPIVENINPIPPLDTAPPSEKLPIVGKKNTLLVSLKKFHVTTPKRSGYNKIYEIRRSRSFFFELADHNQNTNEIHLKIHTNDYHMKTKPISYNNTSSFPNDKYQISCILTHFFTSQRVIPRRIQDKYFNFLRNKLLDRIKIIRSRVTSTSNRNYSTKTFFNFTYKKRRFHFGIYIPCPYINNREHFHNDTPCSIPTPFVMSHNRRSCVMHQHTFSQLHCFKNIKKKHESKSDDIPTDFFNDKSSHANLLYYRWLNGKSKRITSRRLGILYNSNIHARDPSTTFNKGKRHMYRKCLAKFEHSWSPNLRTQKQQDIRFKRSCRRVFNKMRLPPNHKVTNQDYLATARRHHFLFMKSQKIKAPIRHLSYKQCDSIPNANDYLFLVPYFATDFNHKQQIMTKLTQASSSTGPSAPPENYNPISDVFIPKKYHDIIPKDPIFVNDRYVVPGSREWFTYMYNVDESYYPSESSTSRYNAKGKYIARTPIYRSGVVENYVPSYIVEKSQLRRMEKLKEDALTKEAAYHGTTFKHYNARVNTIKSLTDASFHFHERTPSYLARRLENHNSGFSNTTLDKNHNKGLKKNNLRTQGAIRFPTHQYIDVSDDTAEVEYRPNKRDNINNENHYFSFQDHNMKRLRPSPDITNDSLVPGPSSSKTV
uniref:DUF8211 domain-containing protein n=1 Tax=Rhizophagus irregularis (strain DAOM 181602 / DAOM 197198 / MUCL 43194) TaxID=747089 RepID=U9T2B7_RHIID